MTSRRLPSFRGVEAFVALVETGGVRSAARHLKLSVSAVSHRLRLLEAEVGTPLFERGASKLALTPQAQQFYEELLPINRALLAATARLAGQPEVQKLSVSATSVITSYWLASRLGRWREQMPHVRLDIHTIENDVTDGSDIVIRSVLDEEPGPNELKLFGWDIGPICRPEVMERYDLRTPDDLDRVPLIDVARPNGGWRAWLEAANIEFGLRGRDLVMDSHDLMIEAASRGLGVAIGARAMLSDYAARGLVMLFDLTCTIPGGAYVNGPVGGEKAVTARFREWLINEVNPQTG